VGAAGLRDVGDLGPFDLLVTSYGSLLLDDDGRLENTQFATAVLDGAQAIKNESTKRARAAMKLRAHLGVTTTGPPIENRLDDLYSLFSFLNPGLLGSSQSFQAWFGQPIERESAPAVRDRLRRLVAPYIPRRTKPQVMPELPARTEVTLRVPARLAMAATVVRDAAIVVA